MHQINILHHPVIEDGLHGCWQGAAQLPVHNSLEFLLIRPSNLFASFATIVILVVPDQVVLVFLNFEVDEMERRIRPDGL